MVDQPKTHPEDLLEPLQKMDINLKDEEPSKYPPMTALEHAFEKMFDTERRVARLRRSILETENNLKDCEARFGKVAVKEMEEELARMWQDYVELEESLSVNQAKYEDTVKR